MKKGKALPPGFILLYYEVEIVCEPAVTDVQETDCGIGLPGAAAVSGAMIRPGRIQL